MCCGYHQIRVNRLLIEVKRRILLNCGLFNISKLIGRFVERYLSFDSYLL
jgi:hypothetical protein